MDATSHPSIVSSIEEVEKCLGESKCFTIGPNLTEIDLSQPLPSALGSVTQQLLLLEGLKDNTTLAVLKLGMRGWSKEGIQKCCEWLQSNSSLRNLQLWYIETKEGVGSLLRALKNNNSLCYFMISNSPGLGDDEVVGVSELLNVNTSLTTLDLSGTKISDRGVKSLLGEGLKNNTTLRNVFLHDNRSITDEAIKYVLQYSCCLKIFCPDITKIAKVEIEKWLLLDELHRATITGNIDVMKKLLNTDLGKEQLNKVKSFGEETGTPLHFAVSRDNLEAVQVLLEFNADPVVRAASFGRPIDLAKSPEIRQELLARSLETIKINVVGHRRVGKTTTINSIRKLLQQGEHTIKQESRVGLTTSDLLVSSNDKETEVKTRVWDFAGQLEYLPCHRHFLSSQKTIFVVVVDASKSTLEQIRDLKFWLEFLSQGIRSRDKEGKFSKERMLVVAGTKIDLREYQERLEEQYLSVVRKTAGVDKLFNLELIQATTLSNTKEDTLVTLQRELFDLARKMKKESVVDKTCLQRATALFAVLQNKRTETAARKQSEFSSDNEALEYLHNTGEIAFFAELGWVCLDPTLLEQCLTLFIGPERHEHLLLVEASREAIMEKSRVIARIESFLSSRYPSGSSQQVAEVVFDMLLAIGICFDSMEGGQVVFPSEFGEGENLVLPPPQGWGVERCFASTLRRATGEEIGIERFHLVLKGLWAIRYRRYRIFVDGIIIVIPSDNLERSEERMSLIQLKTGDIVITSWALEDSQTTEKLVTSCLGMKKIELNVEREERRIESPVRSGLDDSLDSLPPNSVLTSNDVAQMLSSPSLPLIPLDKKEFVGVLLQESNASYALQQEFGLVKKRVLEFLKRGHMEFDFELEKVVVVFNPQVLSQFTNKWTQYLWETPASLHANNFGGKDSEDWKLRQRVQRKMKEEYVTRGIPGSDRTDIVMAWHAHKLPSVYQNAINGHFVPPTVDSSILQQIQENNAPGDFGHFGRGSYFTQTPQLLLPFLQSKETPIVLQLSWILPGRVYPVTEPLKGPSSLHGRPKVPGFDSHYVLTDGTNPCKLQEEPRGEELIVFDSDQVYPRYLIFLKRLTSFQTHTFGLKAVGCSPLPRGPVLIWVDDKVPDVLPTIISLHQNFPDTGQVKVHHFRTTGEALSWILIHQESIFQKAAQNHLRIGSNSYRKEEVDGLAGKRLYYLLRQVPQFAKVPFLVYCGNRSNSGFTEQEQREDENLRVVDTAKEALEFGQSSLPGWLKDSRFGWKPEKGPGVLLRVLGMTGLSHVKEKAEYYAVVSPSLEEATKSKVRTETKLAGHWDWLSSLLPLGQDLRLVVFRKRNIPLSKDKLVGSAIVVSKRLENLSAALVTEETTLRLKKEEGGGKEEEGLKVKVRVMKLETESDVWFGWI